MHALSGSMESSPNLLGLLGCSLLPESKRRIASCTLRLRSSKFRLNMLVRFSRLYVSSLSLYGVCEARYKDWTRCSVWLHLSLYTVTAILAAMYPHSPYSPGWLSLHLRLSPTFQMHPSKSMQKVLPFRRIARDQLHKLLTYKTNQKAELAMPLASNQQTRINAYPYVQTQTNANILLLLLALHQWYDVSFPSKVNYPKTPVASLNQAIRRESISIKGIKGRRG
jgi:hypothetical protein